MEIATAVDVTVRQVVSARDIRRFLRVPIDVFSGDSSWVPPIRGVERDMFDPVRNPARSYCDFTAAIAWHGGRPAGRIAGIVNHRHNRLSGKQTARFGSFVSIDDEAVACALLRFVEDWAHRRGQGVVIGPMGLTDQDPEGLQIEGYDFLPSLATAHDPPRLGALVEHCGYVKDVDYVTYQVPLTLPQRYEAIAERVLRSGRYKLVEFSTRRQLQPYADHILDLMNHTYAGLYGYVALDEREKIRLARTYLPLLDPRFVKVITRGEDVVAFFIAIPNMSVGIRAARGRLLPFGIFQMRRAAVKTTQLDLLLGGIRQDDRDRGLDCVLGVSMVRSASAAGLTVIDSHHILESNHRMRAICTRWGGSVYKRHRVYTKSL
jgi:hypothetical protein